MVMPAAMAELCPQCGADVRACGTRCKSCGFYLPATPALRSGPPTARPLPHKDRSQQATLAVLGVGGVIVLGLLALGATVALRGPDVDNGRAAPAAATPALSAVEPARLEPSTLLAAAKRQALSWHQDAVLVSVEVSRLDARGVAPGATVEFSYARPNGQRFTGGADTGPERLILRSSDGTFVKSEGRAGKGQVAPEPNCLFEDAWSAAQRAGVPAAADVRLRYSWSEKHARPVWEVLKDGGNVQRRLDGVSCSILTR